MDRYAGSNWQAQNYKREVAMKYIKTNELSIVIFSPSLTHADMAKRLGGEILSAGFVDMEKRECFGESVSLNLKSDPMDTCYLRGMLSVKPR